MRAAHGAWATYTVRSCLDFTVQTIAQGRLVLGGAMRPCTLLLCSSLSKQCCRLLRAGKEVLWHGASERFFWFDGKGGVKKINSEQTDTVGFLLSGLECSMHIKPTP